MSLTPRTRFGSYDVAESLGAGGMGEVFLATDRTLGRRVAIKVLPPAFAVDADRLERFEREARALAALNHPNIVQIYGLERSDGVHAFVMELVEGPTLAERLAAGPLAVNEALGIASQIAAALEAAHGQGIVHRDLKPANVKLRPDDTVKVLDFGIAKTLPAPRASIDASTGAPAVTEIGMVIGTSAYMSPEQARGKPVDERTDVWAFGCVLYEMLTGRRAFAGSDVEYAADIAALPESVGPAVRHTIALCLQRDPQRRLADIRDVRLALLGAFDSGSAHAPSSRVRPRDQVDSLAVLPFATSSMTPDTEFLSDGLTESLINILAELPTLRVMARSTVFRHKGGDPLETGRALGVRAVVAGRVLLRDERLVVGAEMIDVVTGTQLWGQQYRKKFADIFDIQEEIAREISEKLVARIAGEQQLVRRDTNDHDAYTAYLRGRYHWNQRTLEGMKSAAEYFNAAIARDPAYATAHSGLGDALAMIGIYQGFPPRQAFTKAKAAARAALEIAPASAEAMATLGFSTLYYDWDVGEAERILRKAIELKPQYPSAHQWYGMCLALTERTEEALAQWRIARDLDPFSASINYTAAWPLYWARRTDEAIAQLEDAAALHPKFWGSHYYLGLAHAQRGDFTRALSSIAHAQALSDNTWTMEGVGYCYAVAGRTADAEAVLEQLERSATKTYIAPYSHAVIHAGLGNADQAVKYLEDAALDRSWRMAWLRVDPLLDGLRDHPRFLSLLARLGEFR